MSRFIVGQDARAVSLGLINDVNSRGRQPLKNEGNMIKFSCSMISGSDIFYATVIAEDAKQAREMAAAETKKGRPREWSAAVLESEVAGPARFLGSGAQDA
jgi:hypothetical protein